MNTFLLLGETLAQRLAHWNVIAGLILIVVGVLLYIFSKRIAMIAQNKDEVDGKNPLVVKLRVIGLCITLVGMILIIIQ